MKDKLGYVKLNVVHMLYTLSFSFQNSTEVIEISLLGCDGVCCAMVDRYRHFGGTWYLHAMHSSGM
jgi:hypothetical protein